MVEEIVLACRFACITQTGVDLYRIQAHMDCPEPEHEVRRLEDEFQSITVGPDLTTNLKLAKRYAGPVTLGGIIPAEGQTAVCEMIQQGIEPLPHLLPGGQASSNTSCLSTYLLSTNAHHPLPGLGG